ncbi:MAG: glutaredoxin domain-containing protein [Candidatus Thiodiazotropha sp.]
MRLIKMASGCLLVAIAGGSANADAIYKWRDENGKIHFGDRPPATEESTPVTVKPNLYHAPAVEVISGSGYRREKVVMYSTKRCGYCKKARAYFKRNAIPFVEYDVETSRKGKRDFKKMGGRGVPVILVGKRRLNGFSEAGFSEIYQSSID